MSCHGADVYTISLVLSIRRALVPACPPNCNQCTQNLDAHTPSTHTHIYIQSTDPMPEAAAAAAVEEEGEWTVVPAGGKRGRRRGSRGAAALGAGEAAPPPLPAWHQAGLRCVWLCVHRSFNQ